MGHDFSKAFARYLDFNTNRAQLDGRLTVIMPWNTSRKSNWSLPAITLRISDPIGTFFQHGFASLVLWIPRSVCEGRASLLEP